MELRNSTLGIAAALLLVLTPLAEAQAPADDQQLVAAPLNTLHQAASEADYEA